MMQAEAQESTVQVVDYYFFVHGYDGTDDYVVPSVNDSKWSSRWTDVFVGTGEDVTSATMAALSLMEDNGFTMPPEMEEKVIGEAQYVEPYWPSLLGKGSKHVMHIELYIRSR
jgi:hypothetical protein